jgi:hypothetical protein
VRHSNDHRTLGRYRQNHQRPSGHRTPNAGGEDAALPPPAGPAGPGACCVGPPHKTPRSSCPTTPPRRRHVGERGRLCAESWAPGALPLVAGGSARLCITRRPPWPRSGPAYGRFGRLPGRCVRRTTMWWGERETSPPQHEKGGTQRPDQDRSETGPGTTDEAGGGPAHQAPGPASPAGENTVRAVELPD